MKSNGSTQGRSETLVERAPSGAPDERARSGAPSEKAPSQAARAEDPGRLIRRCAETNDAEAWQRLLGRFGPHLRSSVYRALVRAGEPVSKERIDDLLQEVYCRLLERGRRALRRFRGRSEAEALHYFGRLSQNVVVDRLRHEAASKRGVRRLEPLEDRGTLGREERFADPRPLAEEALLIEELRHRFRSSLQKVLNGERARRDRRIVEAALLGGLTSVEISRRLRGDLSAGSVDSVLHRARRRCAEVGLVLPSRAPVPLRPGLPAG